MERYGYSYRVSYAAPQTNEYWGKTSYDSNQVRRPIIVDGDARKRPVVSLTPQNRDSYGNRIETNFQQSHKPLESESSQGLRTYPDSRVEYAVAEDKWNKNRHSDYDRPQEVVEFITKVQTEASRPRFSPLTATHWRSSPEKPTGYYSSTGGYGDRNDYSNKDWQTSPKSTGFNMNNGGYGDRNDYSNKDWQTSPKSTGFNMNNGGYGDRNDYSNKDWLQTSPKSPVFNQNNGGYGDRNDLSSKDWLQTSPKSTGFNSSNGGFNEHNGSGNKDWQKLDAYADRNDSYEDYLRKPTSAKPHHVSWEKPAENSLSSPTSDITTALGYLIEAAKPTVVSHTTAATGTSIPTAFFTTTATRPSIPNSTQYSSYTEPVYTKTTDVKDPEKRYGRYNFSSKPYTTRI